MAIPPLCPEAMNKQLYVPPDSHTYLLLTGTFSDNVEMTVGEHSLQVIVNYCGQLRLMTLFT